MHEIGHQLVGQLPGSDDYEAEREADITVLETFGIAIHYRRPRLVQSVDIRKMGKVIRDLERQVLLDASADSR